jgi:hypothetical protein
MPVKRKLGGKVGKMVGGSFTTTGGSKATCPPGVWCMDTGILILLVLLVVVFLGAAYFMYQTYTKTAQWANQKPTVVVVEKNIQQPPPQIQPPSDPRFAPLSPEQSYSAPPDLRGFPSPPIAAGRGAMPINIPTRGVPDQFQQIGVLTAPGGTETSGTPTRTILPLFGRKLDTNRDRWNYYTRTDGLNPVQVPLEFKRRNCDDDTGCEEIMNGDTISVPVMGQSYVANVYRYSTPRYIPF